jgi:hypothetical protein
MLKAPDLAGHEIPTVPFPPNTGAMDPTFQMIFVVTLSAICAAFLVMALRHWRRTGSPVAVLTLLGGGLCIFIEPIVDVMGLCWFWRDGNWTMFEAFGRPIPMWILPTYVFYVGGWTFYTYSRFEKGTTMAGVWKLWLLYAVVNVLLEEPPLHLGLYTYYGNAQPLQPVLLPLWWTAVNAAMPIVAAALIYKLRPVLTGWKQWLIVAIVPVADAATNAGAGWPLWNAINSSDQAIVTNAAAVATCALAAVLVWIVGLSVARDSALATAPRDTTAPVIGAATRAT